MSAETVPGLRERKKQRTRDDIVAHALRLFATEGFDAVTVERIAAAADVAPRTFFRYFPAKEEVLFADEDTLRGALVDALDRQPPAMPPVAVVHAAARQVAVLLEPARAELVPREALMRSTPALRARELEKRARWEALIAEHLTGRLDGDGDGDGDARLRLRLVAKLALACWQAAVERWLADAGGGTLAEALDRAFADARRELQDVGPA